MALRNFNLPRRQPIHSPLPKLRHKNQEFSAVRLLLFSVPSEIPPSKTKSGTTLGTLLKTVLSSEENFGGFPTVLKRSTFSSCSPCGSSFSVAINYEPRARENPSALVCSLAKLVAIRRYERETETENEGCWAFASKAAAVYHRLSTWMQSHHIRMINSSIQSLFCFFKSKKSKLEFSFLL